MTFIGNIRTTLFPAGYHGKGKQPPFFEGWYFKMVNQDQSKVYTLIPGIYHASDPGKSHAFIQLMNGKTGESIYTPFAYEDFQAAENRFDISIGPNHFSAEGIYLDMAGVAQGEVAHSAMTPWPVTWISPGIMGWYAWVPKMECYHGVVSFDHGLAGKITFGQEEVDFNQGRGYIEKDWGRSFPQTWIWLQTNHFTLPGTCLTASIATIPWVGKAFNGFIVGLWHAGNLYRFATYTGAKIERLDVTDDQIVWILSDRAYRLEIIARRAGGGILRAPTVIEMDRRISETLNARIEVHLFALQKDEPLPLFGDVGTTAGLEAVGDMQRLIDG
jgi:tocopherol cyclase